MPRTVDPQRVARLQRRYLRSQGATQQEIKRFRPVLTAQIGAESNFTQGTGSPAGARDIAQFMPTTAPGYGVTLGDNKIKDDIRGQVRYMLPLLRKYGAEDALRGYNAGVGAIEASRGYSETNTYVNRVLQSAGRYRGGDRGAGAPGGGQPGMQTTPAAAGSAFDAGAPQLADILARPTPPEALVPGGSIAAPAHSAQAVMPQGYVGLQGGGGPAPRSSLADQLAAAGGTAEDFSPAAPAPTASELRKAARAKQGMGGLSGANPSKLVDEISAFAQSELGIEPGSRDRSAGENAAVGGSTGSDHLSGPGFAGREAVDLPTTAEQGGWSKYRATARKLGLKPAKNGFTSGTIKVGNKRYGVQVIFGDENEHGDHIHVGIHEV